MTEQTSIRFSVVITAYNRRDYVLEAIRSVREQTYPAHEIIVVDDGSGDGTAAAVCQKYPDVVLFEQPNLGVSLARNTGLALATGEWICFLDDDDLWHKDKLQVTAEYLTAHPDCQAVRNPVWFFTDSEAGPTAAFGFQRDFVAASLEACHAAVADGDPSTNETDYLQIEGDSFRLLLERNRGVLSSTVVRRDTLIRAGGCCPMQSCGDEWTMFVNVARLCEWHTLPQRLGFSRLHVSQNTGDMRNGLFILAGQVNAWYTGRPLVQRTAGMAMLAALAAYGPEYRQAVQSYLWAALRARQFRIARLIYAAGRMLLPRGKDWLYVHLPPPLTWRWQRYVLKKF